MITIYTAENTDALKNIKADVEFPENSISPWDQIDWIKDNWKKDIIVKTFSPYILNYMNVIIAENKLTDKDVHVWQAENEISELTNEKYPDWNLMCHDENNHWFVDARLLSDPISWMYKEYNAIVNQ